ncbi:hypothetical protein HQQ81_16260 [Microbacteriaceae bacterium VKM Ac-2854]|nr:hypothetical protein [Microbacteriaceae bacterium VKM Ac-2854]
MEHEGKPLAADETDPQHRQPVGVASVHVRALITWIAIFPMVAVGMSVMGLFANDWHPILRALVLTAVVVPLAVYVVVPRLLLLRARLVSGRR